MTKPISPQKLLSGELQGIPERTLERLALYRRILKNAIDDRKPSIYSHELAAISGVTSAQVRRDLMTVGYQGHPRHGYEVEGLLKQLDTFFDVQSGIKMVLVGVGNLGRAILAYFSAKRPHFSIEATFDTDPAKTDRAIHGVRCYPMERLVPFTLENRVHVGIIAVPATEAQRVADLLVQANVTGFLNLAPARLKVPSDVFVENLDMTLSIEKVSFFAKSCLNREGHIS